MPSVASDPKELYLSSSLKELNKKTEVKPDKVSTKMYVSIVSLTESYIKFYFNSMFLHGLRE